jgi:hypothetical protein
MSRVLTAICVIAGLTGVGLMLVGASGIRSGHADAGCGGCIWLVVGVTLLVVDVVVLVTYG